MIVDYKCKLCGRAGQAEADSDCDPAWIETFRKILVCNPCYDLRGKFRKAEARIIATCITLSRLGLMKVTKEIVDEAIQEARTVLIPATRRYTEAMAVYRKLPSPIWSNDLPEKLLAKPSQYERILKDYRDSLRKTPQQQEMPVAYKD
jgi:hypothetical protein